MRMDFLGFDLRYKSRDWGPERREQYLIKPDVEQPLSVDKAVFPSIFDFDNGAPNRQSRRLVVQPREFRLQALGLWGDYDAMSRHGHDRNTGGENLISIAVAVATFGDPYWGDFVIESSFPGEDAKRWRFAGCDVADKFLTSGVSNCGLGDELHSLRQVWACRINEDGLFSAIEHASNFARFLDSRVAEHAPFFPFGIYVRLGE